jgi:hypothetical protein
MFEFLYKGEEFRSISNMQELVVSLLELMPAYHSSQCYYCWALEIQEYLKRIF